MATQTTLHYCLTFTRSCTQSHTDGVVQGDSCGGRCGGRGTDLEPLDLGVLVGPLRVLLREEELHGHHGGAAAFQLQNLAQVLADAPGRARRLKNKTG